jgi:peptidoglycan/LPS O-acetylase OafA/YrhL
MTRILSWLVEKLGRVTNGGAVIREIDGLRFIAISSVILFHIAGDYFKVTRRFEIPSGGWQAIDHPLVRILSPAWFGVQLFFAISGFVLALPYARHYLFGTPIPSLKDYYLRRLTRIEPPYLICVVVYMLVLLRPAKWAGLWPNFIATLFYAHNLMYGELSKISGVFWSLEVEVQFYLIAPFLALWFKVKPAWLRRCLLIGLTAFASYFIPRQVCVYSPRLSLSVVCSLQFFLPGFLLVEIYLSKWIGQSTLSYKWDVITLFGAIMLLMVLLGDWERWWLLPFVIVMLYVSFFLGKLSNRFITHPMIYTIGGMCYSLYLYHILLINYLAPLTLSWWSPQRALIWDLLLQVVVLGFLILFAGSLLFYFVEKPFMRVRQRRPTAANI